MYLIPISRCISVSLSALIIAPLLTLARHAATYQVGMPTQSSSQATTVGPFQRAKGVPAFIASANSSCREESSILPNILGLKQVRCANNRNNRKNKNNFSFRKLLFFFFFFFLIVCFFSIYVRFFTYIYISLFIFIFLDYCVY